MKTFLIIIAVIFGIFLLFRVLRYFVGAAVNNNPIDSITPNGTFGFKLGDSQNSVIDKIKRLKLASKEELDEYADDIDFQREIHGDEHGLPLSFTFANDQFGHIKNLCFVFKNHKLAQISILFDKRPEEIPEFMEIVEYRVSQRLGKPTFRGRDIVKWGDEISIYASLDEAKDEDKVMNLFIGLTNIY